jgi:hypothetical protein
MMEATGRVLALSEPDIHTSMTSIFLQKGNQVEDLVGKVLDASFKYYAHIASEKYSIVLIKTRGHSQWLVPLIHQFSPWVHHLFMYRNGNKQAKSLLEMVCHSSDISPGQLKPDMLLFMGQVFLGYKFTDGPDDLVSDALSVLVINWSRHVAEYIKQHRSGIAIQCFCYEELLGKPRELMAAIGKYVGVDFDEDEIESAVDVMKTRSQDGLKIGKKTEHSEGEMREDCVEICRRMGAPSLYSDELLPAWHSGTVIL